MVQDWLVLLGTVRRGVQCVRVPIYSYFILDLSAVYLKINKQLACLKVYEILDSASL